MGFLCGVGIVIISRDRPMAEVLIQQASLDSTGRLRLRPSASRPNGYKYIWRDATNVAWHEACSELYARDGLPPAEQFKRIVGAVEREYGDRLALSPSTTFVDLPNDMVAALRLSAM